MSYFLIVYNRTLGKTLFFKEFDAESGDLALKERFALELAEKDDPNIEVIVLGSSSLDSLKKTHSRYFREPSSEDLGRTDPTDLLRQIRTTAEPKAS